MSDPGGEAGGGGGERDASEEKREVGGVEGGKRKRVLVSGASGYLGGFVVRECVRRGYWVRVLVRARSKVPKDVEVDDVFVGEATNADTLAGMCDGIDIVFSSLGITRQTDAVTYDDVDYGANLAVLQEAERAGVNRFVFVSVVHPEYSLHTDMVAAREKFVNALKESKINSCVVRGTGFFNDMKDFFEMAKEGRGFVLGDGEQKMNPIHGADLAVVCVDAMETEEGEEEVCAGGPDVLTHNEILRIAFEALDRPPLLTHIPLWVVDAAVGLTGILHRRWWNIASFMASMGRHDLVAPQYGTHTLKDFYESLAKEAKEGEAD